MPKILTRLQRDVISYILSSNEERELPVNSAAPYMQAFEGEFSPRLLFTLFMPNASKVILYMAEDGANDSADKRSEFNKRREIIKKPLVGIANFIIDMVEHDYLRVITKHERADLPANYGTRWRRCEAFYASEIGALRFMCSAWLAPKLKLSQLKNMQTVKKETHSNAANHSSQHLSVSA